MKRVLTVSVGAAIAAAAVSLTVNTPEAEIREVLARQVADWNRGNIDAFMNGYDESVVFVSTAVTRGRKPVLESYRKRYPSRDSMGTLTFSSLEVRVLASDHASVIGQWNLKRNAAGGGDTGGWFTLLFRRTASGWKIVLDHTSARQRE